MKILKKIYKIINGEALNKSLKKLYYSNLFLSIIKSSLFSILISFSSWNFKRFSQVFKESLIFLQIDKRQIKNKGMR